MEESLAKVRHERSKKDYPGLRLDDDEYVELALKRAKVCLSMIWIGLFVGLGVVLIAFLLVLVVQPKIDARGRDFLFIILFALLAATILIWLLALKIYSGNKLYVTNKHVIQMIMISPVSTSVNVIDLFSIEDASFKQENLLQKMFNYGTLRLSTVGDETTYTFPYSDISSEQLKRATELITKAKKLTLSKEAKRARAAA